MSEEVSKSERLELRRKWQITEGVPPDKACGKMLGNVTPYTNWLEGKVLANELTKTNDQSDLKRIVRFLERYRYDIAELFLHKVQDDMEVGYKNETFDGNEVYFQNAGEIGFDVVDEIISLAKAKDA